MKNLILILSYLPDNSIILPASMAWGTVSLTSSGQANKLVKRA